MLAQQILTADILDIVFEGRNKEYGAYVLRKQYNSRLKIAMLGTGIFAGLIITFLFLSNKNRQQFIPPITNSIEVIINPPPTVPEKKLPVLPVEKPPAAHKPKPPSIANIVPVIVKDEIDIKTSVPTVDMLDNSLVSNVTETGIGDARQVQAPSGNGTTNIPEPVINDNIIHSSVDVESSFPGGKNAWIRFLLKTFRYPLNAEEKGIDGSVLVQFVVDTLGNVSNVEALSGAPELTPEAIRVIGRSGKWTPAIQHGRKVKSYKRQAIIFKLSE